MSLDISDYAKLHLSTGGPALEVLVHQENIGRLEEFGFREEGKIILPLNGTSGAYLSSVLASAAEQINRFGRTTRYADRLISDDRPIPLALAFSRPEFNDFDRLDGPTLVPERFGAFVRNIGGRYALVYQTDYVAAALQGREFNGHRIPDFMRGQLHEMIHIWMNNYVFTQRIEERGEEITNLTEGLVEHIVMTDPAYKVEFWEIVRNSPLDVRTCPVPSLGGKLFAGDTNPPGSNLNYQFYRKFMDYLAEEVGIDKVIGFIKAYCEDTSGKDPAHIFYKATGEHVMGLLGDFYERMQLEFLIGSAYRKFDRGDYKGCLADCAEIVGGFDSDTSIVHRLMERFPNVAREYLSRDQRKDNCRFDYMMHALLIAEDAASHGFPEEWGIIWSALYDMEHNEKFDVESYRC